MTRAALPGVVAIGVDRAVRRAASVAGAIRASGSAGQGLVEYGLILVLAALVTVIALVFFGGAIATALSLLGDAIDSSR